MQRLLVVTAATLLLTPHPIAQSTALFVLGLAALVSMLFFTVPIPEWFYAQHYTSTLQLTYVGQFLFIYAVAAFLTRGHVFGAFIVVFCWIESFLTDYIASRAYDDWEGNFVWYNPNADTTYLKVVLHVIPAIGEDEMDLTDRGYTLIHFSDLPRNP